jgi:signal transduction histidine kinase/ligand-binding sensor domain-containing protein
MTEWAERSGQSRHGTARLWLPEQAYRGVFSWSMRALHLACVVLLFVGCAGASAAPLDITQYAHATFGPAQGAPDKIGVIAQTSDGFLWLGTAMGLYRFDGVRFERIKAVGNVPLLGEYISGLEAPRSGGLWIGYQFGGASFLDSHGLRNYPPENDGLPPGSTQSFAIAPEGVVWAGTHRGLARFDGKRWADVTQALGLPFTDAFDVMTDKSGDLWLNLGGNKIALLRRGSKRVQVYPLPTMNEFRQDSNGRVWILADNPSCLYLLDSSRDDIPPCRRLPAPYTDFWLIDRSGGLWLEAGGGVNDLPVPSPNGDRALRPERRSAPDPRLLFFADRAEPISAMEDREGNIWFGTTLGLEQLRVPRLRRHGPFEDVVVLGAGNHNSLWVATTHFGPDPSGDDFFQMKDGRMVPYRGGPTKITASYRDATGVLWVGGYYSHSWKLNDSTWEAVAAPPEFAEFAASGDNERRTQAIARDTTGDLWLSVVRVGLFRLRDRQWEHVSVPGLPAQEFPLAIYPDADGSVWLGYSRGRLAALTHDTWRLYAEKDGLNIGSVLAFARIKGQLWIGGELGLQRIHDGRFESVPGLTELGTVKGLLQAKNGDLWLSTYIGGVHVTGQELRRLDAAPGEALAYEKLGTLDGMPGVPTAIRPLSTVLETDDGRIWFEADDRFSSIDPTERIKNAVVPAVIIGNVRDNGRQREPAGSLTLFPNARNVAIDYTAPSLSIPSRVRFKYRLENFDDSWQDVGTRRTATYNSLPPGRYVFHVIAANNDGVWNDEGASLRLIVPPLFYQTLWFRSLCVILFLAAAAGLYQLRLRQLARQYGMRLEERVNERTRIARELHDTLLQSFQGHLLHLQVVSELFPTHPQESKQKLDSAIDQAAAAIREGRDAVQDLRSSTVTNDLALALNTLGQELAVDKNNDSATAPVFHIEVGGTARDLRPGVGDEIYRIAGEALRNAFSHADAKHIEMEIQYEARQLQLRLRDDGKGIDPKLLGDGGREGHYGLRGMRERAKLLGGKLTVWSQRNSGTEVELIISAARAYASSHRLRRFWLSRPGAVPR